jgi:HemX protein
MEQFIHLFKVLLPMLYLVVWGLYLWLFWTENDAARRWSTRAALLTVFVHLGAMVVRSLSLQRLPMGNNLEFFSSLALAVLVMYLAIERIWKVKNTGFLVVGVALAFEFVADAFIVTTAPANELLTDPGYAGHAVLVLLSYTALSLSFVYALLYLVLSRQLARKQFGLLFRRLPSLETLERMSVGGVKLALPLMFASLALGHLWMYDLADRLPAEQAELLSPFDPKVLISWVVFLAYALGLAGHQFLGWRGPRMNRAAVAAFVIMFVSMGVVHHFFPSFHKFRSLDRAENSTSRQGEAAPLPLALIDTGERP